ncbi:hypothetical protein DH26_gp116 [Chloriridovirus anopheles1]|uniref:Uncharacterized protein n=1 Tax=Chloriridovirus anopheles1 TaxID=1465751 RepID=W8QRI7_9VIRU|nr:hypothetical protein DH26_gp116 [Anopheles minimus iridovirus]AHL67607.1 hypothetical protein AMIV_116 [Anopheles minimus iridovirus]
METLLSETTTVEEWCETIIKRQEKEVYSCLTSPRDLNHVVKGAVQEILDHLKQQGKDALSEVVGKPKEALAILLQWLGKHEVWKPSRAKPLNDEEVETAFEDLYVSKYAAVDRKFTDPQIRGQNYGLFSFHPTKDAKPGPDGIYGFIKIRGAFNRLEEAEEKSKELIQYFSANKIYVCEIGSPVPIQDGLVDRENIVEVDHPDRENDMDVKYSDLVKEQSLKEKKEKEEILNRTEALKADVKKGPEDKEPLQLYLELNQKRATGAYLYIEHQKKLEENKQIVLSARKQIAEMDEKYPHLQHEFMEHYRKTCADCGIDKATDDMAVMIKKFFGEDPDLGF